MSSNLAKISRVGHDMNWLKEPPHNLKCLICLCVARDPYQHPGDATSECGKVFCRSCITKYWRNKAACPNCRRNLTIYEDSKSARDIKALKVKCNYLVIGCRWVGELGSFDTHLQSCDYALVPCTNKCTNKCRIINSEIAKFKRKDLKDHLTNDCPKRQFKCPHCQKTGEHQERTTTHLETCPKVDTCCEVKAHRSCEPVHCKYAKVGCKVRPLRKDLKKHEEDVELHFQVTTEKVLELTEKLIETTEKLTETNAALMNMILQDGTTVHTEWVNSLTNVTRTLRFCNYQQYKMDNTSFSTPPFYTSSKGYKLYISVFANGWGTGKGTHVSVGAHLMKGDNDDSLSWPFTGTVTFELLNQLKDDKPKFRLTCQRVGDDKRGGNFGSVHFISHADLDNSANKYLKDDTLVFKVTVTVPSLIECASYM